MGTRIRVGAGLHRVQAGRKLGKSKLPLLASGFGVRAEASRYERYRCFRDRVAIGVEYASAHFGERGQFDAKVNGILTGGHAHRLFR
jgi:hypothetical protein